MPPNPVFAKEIIMRLAVALCSFCFFISPAAAEQIEVVVESDPNLTVPFGFDFLPDGSLVIADLDGHRVCEVSKAGKVSVIAGDGTKGHRDGSAAQARFNMPHNVVVHARGDLLVSDTQNHCVRRISLKTGEVSTIAGAAEKGSSDGGGLARMARFNQAYHVDATGNGCLLADLGNRRIYRVCGDRIRPLAGNGKKGVPDDGSKALDAPLVDPRAVAADPQGNLWILERTGHALRVVDPKGRIRTVAGTGKAGPASSGPALRCTLNGPKFIWIEKSGDVLIADTDNHCIRRYSRGNETLTTIAGTGKMGKGPPGGLPTETALNQPHGVGVAPDGTIYIADSLNHRVLRVVK